MTDEDRVLLLVQRLDSQNRMLQRVFVALGVVACVLLLGSAGAVQDPQKDRADEPALHDVLRTRRLELANGAGEVVAVLHSNESSDQEGWLTDYYDSGRRRWRAEIDDNRFAGKYVAWWPNGLIQEEGTYTEGRRHGLFTFYHENGQPRERGAFTDGARTGIWISWHENGRKRSEGLYENDHKIGDWREWHEDEAKAMVGKYVDGELDGEVRWFWPGGEPRRLSEMVRGKRSGVFQEWDQEGRLRVEGSYRDGSKTGEWKVFREDGSLDERRSRTYGGDAKGGR